MKTNSMTNKIKDNELNKVVAGNNSVEPEEFEWKAKGYTTPIKDNQPKDGEWAFTSIGNTNDKLSKISGGTDYDPGKEESKIKALTNQMLKLMPDVDLNIIMEIIKDLRLSGKDAAISTVNKVFSDNSNYKRIATTLINNF